MVSFLVYFEPINSLFYGLKVCKRAPQPPVIDIVHATALGLFYNRILSLFLGADKKNRPTFGNRSYNKIISLLQ